MIYFQYILLFLLINHVFSVSSKWKVEVSTQQKTFEGNILLNYKILEYSDLFFIITANNMIKTLSILLADFKN